MPGCVALARPHRHTVFPSTVRLHRSSRFPVRTRPGTALCATTSCAGHVQASWQMAVATPRPGSATKFLMRLGSSGCITCRLTTASLPCASPGRRPRGRRSSTDFSASLGRTWNPRPGCTPHILRFPGASSAQLHSAPTPRLLSRRGSPQSVLLIIQLWAPAARSRLLRPFLRPCCHPASTGPRLRSAWALPASPLRSSACTASFSAGPNWPIFVPRRAALDALGNTPSPSLWPPLAAS